MFTESFGLKNGEYYLYLKSYHSLHWVLDLNFDICTRLVDRIMKAKSQYYQQFYMLGFYKASMLQDICTNVLLI